MVDVSAGNGSGSAAGAGMGFAAGAGTGLAAFDGMGVPGIWSNSSGETYVSIGPLGLKVGVP